MKQGTRYLPKRHTLLTKRITINQKKKSKLLLDRERIPSVLRHSVSWLCTASELRKHCSKHECFLSGLLQSQPKNLWKFN
jgi:hypothetical protein